MYGEGGREVGNDHGSRPSFKSPFYHSLKFLPSKYPVLQAKDQSTYEEIAASNELWVVSQGFIDDWIEIFEYWRAGCALKFGRHKTCLLNRDLNLLLCAVKLADL